MCRLLYGLGACCLVSALLPAGYAMSGEPIAAQYRAQHHAAVQQARLGEIRPALHSLRGLYENDPQNLSLRNDYAVVAAWGGQHQLTDSLLSTADLDTLPDHVATTYARSLRDQGQWQRSLLVYESLLARNTKDLDAQLGKTLVLADVGNFEEAEHALTAISQDRALAGKANGQIALVCGYIAERQQLRTRALACYNQGLRKYPDNPELIKRRILAASALGASGFARQEANANPGLLSEEEQVQLALNAAATQIRWSDLPVPEGSNDSAQLALAAYSSLTPVTQANQRQLDFDRIVALTAAREMETAVAEFDALRVRVPMEQIPYYVLDSIGGAYLYLEEGRLAEDFYRAALEKLPANADPDARFNIEMGLFYALADTQQFDSSFALITAIGAGQEPWIRPNKRIWIPNSRYTIAREAKAMSSAYREEYDTALEDLDSMLSVAPANAGLRLSKATVYRWRGWHRASAAELGKVHAPSDQFNRQLAEANLALETYDFAEADQLITQANQLQRKERSVVDVTRLWEVHQSPQLLIDANYGESDGTELGSNSYTVDTSLFSAPFAHNYRAMAHSLYRYGDYDEGQARDHRLGAGIEYRRHFLRMTGEIHKGLEDNDKTGISVTSDWNATDHWQLNGGINYNSPEAPLRASRDGITADDISGGVTYRLHEAAQVRVFAGAMDFDDGNLRKLGGSSMSGRIANFPKHKIRAEAGLYFSDNSIDDAPYFNPENDAEVTIGLEHEWRIYQNYESRLTQFLAVGAGIYDQQNYDSDSMWNVRLEHNWEFTRRLFLNYGIKINRRPYDGTQEKEESVFLTLGGRL